MGKAARRSVASDPSSPTLPYHYQHQHQPSVPSRSREVHQAEHYYDPSPLSYSAYTAPVSGSSFASSSSSSSSWASDFESESTEPLVSESGETVIDAGDSATATASLASPSTPAGPQLQAPRTATLQSASFAPSSLAPARGSSSHEPAELGSGGSEPFFIHPSTTATPRRVTPEFSTTNQTQVDRERERLRMEFYATYDVMTGVRIAATLGGFFGLMVFLVIYKSRTRSTAKALKDPTIAAVAAAVIQEEEERELQEAIEATAFSLLQEELNINYPGLQRDRLLSLGNVSAPPMLSRGRRMSSISGGYSSLLNPSRRFSYSSTRGHRNSVSVSSRVLSAYNMGGSFGQDDYVLESDGEEADDEFDQFTTTAEIGFPTNYLSVPSKCNESRRSSAMTCCSTESSFLERRCSAITLGLSSLPPISRSPSRQQSRDDTADWEPFYPGINIIEPTPKSSPCPSERIAHRTTHDYERSSSTAPSGQQQQQQRSTERERHRGAQEEQLLRPTASGSRPSVALYDADSSIDCISEYPIGSGCLEDGFGYRQQRPPSSARPNSHLEDLSIVTLRGSQRPYSHSALISSISSTTAAHQHQADTSHGAGAGVGAGGVTVPVGRAPLASLSSFRMSSADCQDTEPKSCGSDSVFGEDSGADTDEDLQQFSTDSDELSLTMPYEDEEEHQAQREEGEKGARSGRCSALYRRQSTLAQCEGEEELDNVATPTTTYEVEYDDRRRLPHHHHQQQQQQQQQPTTDTSYISSLSISNRSDRATSGGNRIETKAIIERQHLNDSRRRQSPLGAIPKTTVAVTRDEQQQRTVRAPSTPIVTVHAPDDDDRPPVTSHRHPTASVSRHTVDDPAGRCSSSSSSAPKRGSSVRSDASSVANARQQHQQQRNVEVNVIIKGSSGSGNTNTTSTTTTTTSTTTGIKSPSVILELPILAIDEDDDPSSAAGPLSANDPCIPGPSRKWSKETLF
ncbi:pneumococcal serine-rich repeat protein [Anopheles aquasalis]|uniref:pneumococcal serine-rich repeat protein n=1 Tax=Anopheles aquasalis TaxID=42839 RepID=UPI00215A2712|nr:pneumococcal serine-rich repeat protein [Anopheles aquasalis]